MIERIECPNPAYRKILEAGLDKRILDKKEIVGDLVGIEKFPDNIDEIFARAERILDEKGKITQKREIARNILLFGIALEDDNSWEIEPVRKCSLEYPSFLAQLVLGEDIFKFRKMGFPTRRSLEESIASFCIGEENSLFCSYYPERIWRNGKFKNRVSRNEHGDLFVLQTNVSGRYFKEETLFGEEEIFDTMLRNPPAEGFGAYQDWSGFLLSLLRYAQALGEAKMPEIANWREIAEKNGQGGNWADGHCDFGLDWLMEMKLLEDEERTGKDIPIQIVNGGSNSRNVVIPYLAKDRKMVYRNQLGEDLVVYDEKDLREALIANYCYFARDRLLMAKIMDRFIEETK